MLQIGQIRKNASGTYLSPLSKYSSSVYISWYDNGQVFEDYALHLGTAANPAQFKAKTTYYLRFSATRQDSNLQPAYGGEISNFDFSLVLYVLNISEIGFRIFGIVKPDFLAYFLVVNHFPTPFFYHS